MRTPCTIRFNVNDQDPDDQYARLYSDKVVDAINDLALPRYGLGNYIAPNPEHPPTSAEQRQLQDLSRAGKRLMGFCRTNLFKRLESSGMAFIQSVERHVLRNFIFLHAIENDRPLPIGSQDPEMLDTRFTDEDKEQTSEDLYEYENDDNENVPENEALHSEADFRRRAAEICDLYDRKYGHRFKWLRASLFIKKLARDLHADALKLMGILESGGAWDPQRDAKLAALFTLLTQKHPGDKVLVFTQFADTVRYLDAQLRTPRAEGSRRCTWRNGQPDPHGLAFQSGQQQKARPGSPGKRTACPDCNGHPVRRSKPSGLRHCGELRSSLGHHPADPAGRPCGPHRPDG